MSSLPRTCAANACVHLAGCKERDVSNRSNAGPGKGNAWFAGTSRALKNEPALVEIACAQIAFANPIVDRAAISPHNPSVVIRIDLKQQSPVKCPGREYFLSRVF